MEKSSIQIIDNSSGVASAFVWKHRGITLLATITIGLAIAALVHYGLHKDFTSGCFIAGAAVTPFALMGGGFSIYHLITSSKVIQAKPSEMSHNDRLSQKEGDSEPNLNKAQELTPTVAKVLPPKKTEESKTLNPAKQKEKQVVLEYPDVRLDEYDSSMTLSQKLTQIRIQNQQAAPVPSEVSPEECLHVLSYLAESVSPSGLFKEPFRLVQPRGQKMNVLLEECAGKTTRDVYKKIAVVFLENLPTLNTFLHEQTQAILLLKNSTREECEKFKLLNKQMRMILLFFMSQEPKKASYLERYKKHLTHSLGNREWNSINQSQPCYYFETLRKLTQKKTEEEFQKFLWSFSMYRKHALLRLFADTKLPVTCPEELKPLLFTTWFHGTRAMTSLGDTDFTLIPAGWLHRMGHTSFFGEMSEGCQKEGVNANSLSGTFLDRVDWSVHSYATQFQFDIQKEYEIIERRFKITPSIEQEIKVNYVSSFLSGGIRYLPRVEVALNRWIRWDQAGFEEKKSDLLERLDLFKKIIAQIKKTKPKEIFNWHDTYFSSQYESVCSSVEKIEALLKNPPSSLTQEQKSNIEGNFPVVLGSLTLLSQPTCYDDHSGEHTIKGAVQLGTDLQILCVNQEDLTRAKRWLQTSLPDSGITLFSFQQLEKAQKINQENSPFLADIFSVRKFERLQLE